MALGLGLDPVSSGASAAGRAYASVADAIVSGALPAGSLITEGDVAAELGLSRTPVREAFLSLESRGLLRLFPKRGAVVTTVDDAEASDLIDVRVMLESTAVQLAAAKPAATRHASTVTEELEALVAEQADAAASGDLLAFARADHRFHARVVEEAGNTVIDDIYASLGPRLERLTHRVITRDASLQDFIAEHRSLAKHVATGKSREYERELRAHVETRHRV